MREFVISDTHFSHKKMCGEDSFIAWRKRFKDVEEMNAFLIKQWNNAVSSKDTVYFLGDFAMNLKPKDAVSILKKLNGNIVFIKGNHDPSKFHKEIMADPELSSRVMWHDIGVMIKRDKKVIHMTHYPLVLGERGNRINLHGHIHEQVREEPNLLNVGVDSPELWDTEDLFGTPVPLSTALSFLGVKRAMFDLNGYVQSKHGIIE